MSNIFFILLLSFNFLKLTPHNGPDEVSNVLCLSPNMHVLFDLGAISINDDLTLIGKKGRLTINDEHDLSKDAIRYHRDHIFRE